MHVVLIQHRIIDDAHSGHEFYKGLSQILLKGIAILMLQKTAFSSKLSVLQKKVECNLDRVRTEAVYYCSYRRQHAAAMCQTLLIRTLPK